MSAFAHPYARAFLETAPRGYDVARFLESARTLVDAIEGDARLRAFLSTPAVPAEVKAGALAALARRAGLDAFGERFFEMILKNHRLGDAAEILRAVRDAHDAALGIVEGRVIVATPIAEAERKTIEDALTGRIGQSVRLRVEIDPSILAGFVARVGSNVFDASATAAIRQFEEKAKGTGA
jgi:F-type H+-transporting ATPase subunit delta